MNKKKIDFFQIKEVLQDQPSANLALIVMDCVQLMRTKTISEYTHLMSEAEKLKNKNSV